MTGDRTLAVHRDVLRSVAGRLRTGLAGLDAALTRVQAAGPGVSSLAGWPTGDAFSGNVTSVSSTRASMIWEYKSVLMNGVIFATGDMRFMMNQSP